MSDASEVKRIVVTEADIVAAPFYLTMEQTHLSLLQRMGGPISGSLLLSIDEGFDITMTQAINSDRIYIFKRRLKP